MNMEETKSERLKKMEIKIDFLIKKIDRLEQIWKAQGARNNSEYINK